MASRGSDQTGSTRVALEEPHDETPGFTSRRPGVVFTLVVAVLSGAASAVLWLAERGADAGSCTQPTASRSTSTVETPATLTLQEAQRTQLELGRTRQPVTAELTFDVDDPAGVLDRGTLLPVTVLSFRRESTSAEPILAPTTGSSDSGDPDPAGEAAQTPLTPAGGATAGTLTSGSFVVSEATFIAGSVVLGWCVDRGDVAPGRYEGVLVIDDPRVNTVSVSVSVTLSYANTPAVVWLVPTLAGVGLLLAWNIRASRTPSSVIIDKNFGHWLVTVEGCTALVAGLAAMTATFWATYMDGQTWGDSSQDVVLLVGALYTSFVAAAATVNVLAAPGRTSAAAGATGAPTALAPDSGPVEDPADTSAVGDRAPTGAEGGPGGVAAEVAPAHVAVAEAAAQPPALDETAAGSRDERGPAESNWFTRRQQWFHRHRSAALDGGGPRR